MNPATLTYTRRCASFQVHPDPSVLATLETQWHVLQITPSLAEEGCLLPLVDVLGHEGGGGGGGAAEHVKELRVVPGEALREARADGCSGDVDCRCLSKIMAGNTSIVDLDVAFLGMGPAGMDEIAAIVRGSTTLQKLRIAHNPGGRNNYQGLVEALRLNTTLRVLDVSYNHLGHGMVTQLRKAAPTVKILAEGNHVVEEAVNALTHFLGLVVALCAVLVLMSDLSHAPKRVWWSCFTYSVTLLCMFSCSMVFHASTNSPRVAKIANIFDHAAIFLLIAGSCSPFLHVALHDSDLAWMVALVQWSMALVGITFNLYGNHTSINRRQTIEMVLYFSQGLMVLLVKDELAQAVGKEVSALVWASGITYAVGSIFFVAEHAVHPIGHGIWHLFVCVAAMWHWRAVHLFVLGLGYPLDVDGLGNCSSASSSVSMIAAAAAANKQALAGRS